MSGTDIGAQTKLTLEALVPPQVEFLSFDDKEIPEAKMRTELFPIVNNFILEMHNLKKTLQDKNVDPVSKPDLVKKFKLLIDVISIYRDPSLLTLIKQYREEKEKERLREEEMEKMRLEMFKRRQNESTSLSDFPFLGSFWGTTQNDVASEEEDILSELSEDEFMKDNVNEMLDEGYESITKNSMLYREYGILRKPHCELHDVEPDEQGDEKGDEQGGEQAGDQAENPAVDEPDKSTDVENLDVGKSPDKTHDDSSNTTKKTS
ncbi:hypothetical protein YASMINEVIRUS_888 [Yasminevirus sp. GU-2018]|uniref:Uncharacterized protein n=1 Tax=Yasminevirus sp. GU-2018 TaxID=2420051 RepID=A0A5K0U9F8_9VIRU|nr:hypothetical protein YASMINEVIRUS_888 [Yasminevirus sp. GU-2018]